MTAERRAVLLLLGLALGGQALRLWRQSPDTPPGQLSLLPVPSPSGPAAHRDSGLALARPLAQGEQIDLDRAGALEIARLPRVGLHLAKAIVADRQARGPFGSLEAVDRVPGVGPGLLGAIREQVRFSAPVPPSVTAPALPPEPTRNAERGTRNGPPLGTQNQQPILDLNTATAAELEALPRVGPALASRIVAFRQKYGPFPAVDSLVRVPGIGPATLALLRERLVVR